MIINFLTLLSWVLLTLGVLMLSVGIYLDNEYEDSLERMLDAVKGVQKSYKHLVVRGFWLIILSATFLIAKYLM